MWMAKCNCQVSQYSCAKQVSKRHHVIVQTGNIVNRMKVQKEWNVLAQYCYWKWGMSWWMRIKAPLELLGFLRLWNLLPQFRRENREVFNYFHWSYNILQRWQSRLRVMPCRFYDCKALQSRAEQFPNHDVVVKCSEQQRHSRFLREDLEPSAAIGGKDAAWPYWPGPVFVWTIKCFQRVLCQGTWSCSPSPLGHNATKSIMQRGDETQYHGGGIGADMATHSKVQSVYG